MKIGFLIFILVVLAIGWMLGIVKLAELSSDAFYKNSRRQGWRLGIATVLLFSAPWSLLGLVHGDDRPCAKYDYTYIKGIKHRSCVEHWEEAP